MAKAKQAPQAPKAKSTSVAIPGNALAIFGEANNSPLIPLQTTGGSSPYIQFFHSNSNNSKSMLAALPGLENGDPIYVDGNEYTKLEQFVYLASPFYFQYFAQYDGGGNIITAMLPDGTNPRKPWKETIDAICIVVYEKSLLPCRIRFLGPKAPGHRAAINAVNDVIENDDWPKRHKDNHMTSNAGAKLPKWSWVQHGGTISRKSPKDGGNDYEQLDTTAEATNIHTIGSLIKLSADAEWSATMASCVEDYNNRMEEVKRKIPG